MNVSEPGNLSSDAFEEHRNFLVKKFEIPLHSEPLSLMFIPEQQPQNQKIWPSHKTQRNRPRSYRQKPPNKRRPLKRPRSKAQPNAIYRLFTPNSTAISCAVFFGYALPVVRLFSLQPDGPRTNQADWHSAGEIAIAFRTEISYQSWSQPEHHRCGILFAVDLQCAD